MLRVLDQLSSQRKSLDSALTQQISAAQEHQKEAELKRLARELKQKEKKESQLKLSFSRALDLQIKETLSL